MRKWEVVLEGDNVIKLVASSKKEAVDQATKMLDAKVVSVEDKGPAVVSSPQSRSQEKSRGLMSNRGRSMVPVSPVRRGKKIGPNKQCPCGSGKKYKKCCGRGRRR